MINQVLSIKQMQELKELGIDISKASMCWLITHDSLLCTDNIYLIGSSSYLTSCFDSKYISIEDSKLTFTLQDILEMLPPAIFSKDTTKKASCFVLDIDFGYKSIGYTNIPYEEDYISIKYNNLLQGAFELLKWCKQNNHI